MVRNSNYQTRDAPFLGHIQDCFDVFLQASAVHVTNWKHQTSHVVAHRDTNAALPQVKAQKPSDSVA